MRKNTIAHRSVIMILAMLWLGISGSPFFFMMQTGLKTQFELLTGSVWALPESPILTNYTGVITGSFLMYFRNSAIVVSLSVFLILFISALASYIFSRMNLRGIALLFGLIMAGMTIPIHVTLITVYLLAINLGYMTRCSH